MPWGFPGARLADHPLPPSPEMQSKDCWKEQSRLKAAMDEEAHPDLSLWQVLLEFLGDLVSETIELLLDLLDLVITTENVLWLVDHAIGF